MLLEPQFIIAFLLLGTIAGFSAGLLGVGGGGVMVPILTSIFLAMGVPVEKVVHLALGTSMAAIVATSFSSMRAHHLRDGVLWDYIRGMSPGIVVGAFLATYIVATISSLALVFFFSLFMGLMSVKMFIGKKTTFAKKPSGKKHLFFVGSFIGAISALASIGGGSLTVPYLVRRNIDIKKAIGTSAAIGLPISFAGTIGYIVNGWSNTAWVEYTVGFVYLPAVALISITSFLFAPLGAKMVHHLPVSVLKKVFALLLMVLSIKMLLSII